MQKQQIFNENYLEELFFKGEFPSVQEMLDNTKILQQGNGSEIKAMMKWRRGLYNKFHLKKYRQENKSIQTSYNRNEQEKLNFKSEHFDMTPVKYIKHAALYFPQNYTPTLCRDDILASKALLIGYYNIVKKLSRHPKIQEESGFNLLAETILAMKKRFDSLTNHPEKEP